MAPPARASPSRSSTPALISASPTWPPTYPNQSTDIVAPRWPAERRQPPRHLGSPASGRRRRSTVRGRQEGGRRLHHFSPSAPICSGSCTSSTSSSCSFDDADLANGLNYAVSHGARVINLSLGGTTPDTPAFETALQNAVAAGVVVTISAGNDGGPNPDWPACRYAVDPRYAWLRSWPSATDDSRPMFWPKLFQPGRRRGGRSIWSRRATTISPPPARWAAAGWLSGTSFSAPHVAGALALLLQAFPSLTGQQALQILFQTATDLGAPGVDPIYGHGLVDPGPRLLAARRAQWCRPPIGGLIVESTTFGASTEPTCQRRIRRKRLPAQRRPDRTVGYDSYNRLFVVDLAKAYRAAPRSAMQAPSLAPRQAQVTLTGLKGGFRLRSELDHHRDDVSPVPFDPTGVRAGLQTVLQPRADLDLGPVGGPVQP